MNEDTPYTFQAPSFALLDEAQNAVLTTQWGSLAIFSTRAVAEQVADQHRVAYPKVKVVPVAIKPVTEQ